MIQKALITAFEPFGTDKINSTQEILSVLPDNYLNIQIVKALLPVEFPRGTKMLEAYIDQVHPSCAICLGQYGGSDGVHFEKFAVNIINAPNGDNS